MISFVFCNKNNKKERTNYNIISKMEKILIFAFIIYFYCNVTLQSNVFILKYTAIYFKITLYIKTYI